MVCVPTCSAHFSSSFPIGHYSVLVSSGEYKTEYSTDETVMRLGSLSPGDRVLLIDDLIATGGTAIAGQFQLRGAKDEGHAPGLSRCAHKSDGPPLKSFLFDVPSETDHYDVYHDCFSQRQWQPRWHR